MNPRKILTNGVFCPIPWTGLMYNFDGTVKNCIRSAGTIGDLKTESIHDILRGDANLDTQQRMLSDQPGVNCHTCYTLENNKRSFDIISDRIFYLRELKHTPLEVYQLGRHELKTIDVRWSNLCNFACVYCGSEFSSRWASEIGAKIDRPTDEQLVEFKNYIFDHAHDLRHVYLAGGEPLLMRENLELLDILQAKNPSINLRINTNLSKVDTRVFEKICEFSNVHWIISAESQGEEFEYIRYGGSWQDFCDNLKIIRDTRHKISFNMLYFLLNFRSLFDFVRYLQDQGFHNNSFIIGALLQPDYLNIRNLPDHVLQSIKHTLEHWIDKKPGYLLEDGLRNIRHYVDQPYEKDLTRTFDKLNTLDQRRNLNSSKIFTELYLLK